MPPLRYVFKKKGLSETAVQKALAKTASKERQQPLYNISSYTFARLLGDADGAKVSIAAITDVLQAVRAHSTLVSE